MIFLDYGCVMVMLENVMVATPPVAAKTPTLTLSGSAAKVTGDALVKVLPLSVE